MHELWQELLRRRVVRVGLGYLASAFVALQAADLILSGLPVPSWLYPAVLTLALIGFPVALALAWAFDIRDGRVRRAEPADTAATPERALSAWPRGSRVIYATLGFVVLTGAAWLTASQLRGDAPLDPDLVAIFPFRTTSTDPLITDLSEGMVDLMAAKLTGSAGPRAVDPRTSAVAWKRAGGHETSEDNLRDAARELRAGRMLLGSIVPAGDRIVISASLSPIGWGRRVEHSVTGPADSITYMVDRLTASLLSLGAGEDEDRLEALTSTSLPALRAYLLGRAAYRGGEYHAARDHFLDALQKDSTFALAAIGVEAAALWTTNPTTPLAVRDEAKRLAFASRHRLSTSDRMVLEALIGPSYPEHDTEVERCRAWQRVHQTMPADAEAIYAAADCMFHFGGFQGHADHLERARVLFEESVAADSAFTPNLEHLLMIAAFTGDSALAARILPLYARTHSAETTAERIRWWSAFAMNDTVTLSRIAASFGELPLPVLGSLVTTHESSGRGTFWSDSIRAVMRDRGGINPPTQYRLLLLHGRERESEELIDAAAAAEAVQAVEAVITVAMYGEGDPAYTAEHVARLSARLETAPAPATPAERSTRGLQRCLVMQWRAWQNDLNGIPDAVRAATGAATSADETPAGRKSAYECAIILRAIEAGLRQTPDARRLALTVDSLSAVNDSRTFHHIYLRLLAARLLEMAGDPAAALTALDRRAVYREIEWMQETRLRESARLAELTGDHDRAIRDYARYLALRTNSDGRPVEYAREARAALQRLTAARGT